jgi:retron-type reverse transcriptase
LLSKQYGLDSIQVQKQMEEWVCKLDMQICAIETIYQSKGNLIPGIDGMILTKEDKLSLLSKLTRTALEKYESASIKQIPIFEGGKKIRFLGILTVIDRVIQTLFLQVLDPVLDVHIDVFNYGYRKGRNSHQAIGHLANELYIATYLNKIKTRIG